MKTSTKLASSIPDSNLKQKPILTALVSRLIPFQQYRNCMKQLPTANTICLPGTDQVSNTACSPTYLRAETLEISLVTF